MDWMCVGSSAPMSSVGSPGARWMTRNETKVMPIRSGTAKTSRRSAYPSRAQPAVYRCSCLGTNHFVKLKVMPFGPGSIP
jgi:hypothetical protein